MNQLETASLHAASIWKCPPQDVSPDDVSEGFPWSRQHTVVLVIGNNECSLVVAFDPEGDPLVFDAAAGIAANLPTLNRMLRTERIRLPHGMPPEQLAQAVRDLLFGLGSFVGTPDFWDEQQDSIHLWTAPTPHGGAEIFRNHCQSPHLDERDGAWTLEFSVFNTQGGVERWHVNGDRESIHAATFEMDVPDRTFLCPYGW
jgi:hypothetical protein